MMSKGAREDKMATWFMRCQQAPVQNLASLQNVIDLVTIKNRRQALQAMGSY